MATWNLGALLKRNPDLSTDAAPEPSQAGRAHSGRRADLGNRYFRSAWEANYARYLNWLVGLHQIDGWDFEPKTFYFPVKRGPTSYTPDFQVFLLGGNAYEWHEVKGHMDNISTSKLKKFQKHYPAEHAALRLIDGKAYTAIANTVRVHIPTWETYAPDHTAPRRRR